jgi:D-alanine-D-alanine ligase-like ATP-grasp enzyme
VSGKIRVGVLMGGASSEREISLASGTMVAQHSAEGPLRGRDAGQRSR